MRVLIIWEDCPDRLRAYSEVLTPAEYERFARAHGTMVNMDSENDSTNALSEWLVGKTPIYDSQDPGRVPSIVGLESLIVSGFAL